MYAKGSVMELDSNSVFIEKTDENEQLVNTYNSCISECERPMRDLRFETEF